MMKNKKLVIFLLLVFFVLAFLGYKVQKLKHENTRLIANQSVILGENKYYKDVNSLYHTNITPILLRNKELRLSKDSIFIEFQKIAKANKGLKSDNLYLYQQIEATGHGEIVVKYDTVWTFEDTTSILTFDISDGYLKLSGEIFDGILDYNYSYSDSVFTTIFETYKFTKYGTKKFFIFRWLKLGYKTQKIDAFLKNKNAKIIDMKSVKIK